MKVKFCFFLSIFLVGCETGPPIGREKSGASVQEFTQARFECLQQSSGRVSSGAANQYGAAFSSGTACNYNMYDACMQSKGWFNTPGGRFTQDSGCR